MLTASTGPAAKGWRQSATIWPIRRDARRLPRAGNHVTFLYQNATSAKGVARIVRIVAPRSGQVGFRPPQTLDQWYENGCAQSADDASESTFSAAFGEFASGLAVFQVRPRDSISLSGGPS
jgi:hypothetical protein